LALESLKPPLLGYASDRPTPPPAEPFFVFLRGQFSAAGEFSTTAPAQLQVFLKTTGYYRESVRKSEKIKFIQLVIVIFGWQSATVYA
jgi:hypothetical protein